MRVTKFTREALASRRQSKKLTRQGYEKISTPICNDGRWRERIVEVEISTDGHSLYVRTDKHRDLAAMEAEYGPMARTSR